MINKFLFHTLIKINQRLLKVSAKVKDKFDRFCQIFPSTPLLPHAILICYKFFMKSEKTVRFSVSIPEGLLRQFDEIIKEKGAVNRSQAVADLIRDALVEHKMKTGREEMAGTITIVYDHHKPHVQENLTSIQHDYHDYIISTLHIHLDHHNCLEVLAVKGEAAILKKIADVLISSRGIKHGKLTLTTTGKDMPG